MTTLRHTITLAAEPDAVWDAIRDFGAIHERLAVGFVTATQRDGDQRIVTFANGVVARESLISTDDERRRLAYSITESPAAMTYHHGSFEVDPVDGVDHHEPQRVAGAAPARTRVVWTVDLLPAEAAPVIDAMMAAGVDAMATTLERLAPQGVADRVAG
jgi:hypothetical protein